jgi:signal transduction histidine kinase
MHISERLFNRLMVGVILLGFLGLFAVGAGAIWMVRQNEEFTAWVSHTYLVEQRLAELRVNLEQAEVARRGFLIQQDRSFYERYRPAAMNLPVVLDRIAELTADNPSQQRRVAQQRALVQSLLPLMEESVVLARQGKADQATRDFRNDRAVAIVRQVRDLTSQMAEEEARLLVTRNQAQQDSERLILTILSAGGLLVLVVASASAWVILRYTRDLTASRNALKVMNLGLETTVAERTADFKRANDEIQRFAYIVSHDLRSPLVNVMGFTAELDAAAKPLSDLLDRLEAEAPQFVTEDARHAVRADLPEAIGFIRSSTQKMDRLINAILRLSREGRRVISPERLDMQALLSGVADGVRHQAAGRDATIEVQSPVPDIVSDRLAVEQIFSNLVENAVKYLAKGRPGRITLRGRVQGDHVIYEVQDNGRGIDAKDHERVFDLFRRSGTQDQPGEGIGLAHVRALAYRLGGLITCESALDQGATFRLSLPRTLTLDRGTPL